MVVGLGRTKCKEVPVKDRDALTKPVGSGPSGRYRVSWVSALGGCRGKSRQCRCVRGGKEEDKATLERCIANVTDERKLWKRVLSGKGR